MVFQSIFSVPVALALVVCLETEAVEPSPTVPVIVGEGRDAGTFVMSHRTVPRAPCSGASSACAHPLMFAGGLSFAISVSASPSRTMCGPLTGPSELLPMGVSAALFAARHGVTVITLSRWETGAVQPTSARVIRALDQLARTTDNTQTQETQA